LTDQTIPHYHQFAAQYAQQCDSDDNQYLLRKALKNADGGYTLKANNPTYDDIPATDEMLTFARFKGIVDYP
jgi:hypothetical protein